MRQVQTFPNGELLREHCRMPMAISPEAFKLGQRREPDLPLGVGVESEAEHFVEAVLLAAGRWRVIPRGDGFPRHAQGDRHGSTRRAHGGPRRRARLLGRRALNIISIVAKRQLDTFGPYVWSTRVEQAPAGYYRRQDGAVGKDEIPLLDAPS